MDLLHHQDQDQDQDQHAIYPSLRGKVVLITGAAEGIGAAAVQLFCRQGSQVVFLDIADDSAAKLLDHVAADDGITTTTTTTAKPVFMHCDVTDLDRLRECAQAVLAQFGRVDVLINNAAAAGPGSRVPTALVTPDSFALDVNVNLRHQFFLTQHIAPAMCARGAGSIINMGSITWRIPATEVPVYTTCKAAVVGMTRTHAREFGKHGVRVNSIMPGSIATQRQVDTVLTDEYKAESLAAQCLKRVLVPAEVARLMLFLASDDSSAITGGSHVCDGGWVGDT